MWPLSLCCTIQQIFFILYIGFNEVPPGIYQCQIILEDYVILIQQHQLQLNLKKLLLIKKLDKLLKVGFIFQTFHWFPRRMAKQEFSNWFLEVECNNKEMLFSTIIYW